MPDGRFLSPGCAHLFSEIPTTSLTCRIATASPSSWGISLAVSIPAWSSVSRSAETSPASTA